MQFHAFGLQTTKIQGFVLIVCFGPHPLPVYEAVSESWDLGRFAELTSTSVVVTVVPKQIIPQA